MAKNNKTTVTELLETDIPPEAAKHAVPMVPRSELDAAYSERNRVVAAFVRIAVSAGWPGGLGKHQGDESWAPEWRNVAWVRTPAGEVSWHIHDSELHLFDGVPREDPAYDGYSTEEKYRRLDAFRPTRRS